MLLLHQDSKFIGVLIKIPKVVQDLAQCQRRERSFMAFTKEYFYVFPERSQRAAIVVGMWLYKEGFGFVILSIHTMWLYKEGFGFVILSINTHV